VRCTRKSGTDLGFHLSTTAREASFPLSLSDEQDSSQPFGELQADGVVLDEGKSYLFSSSVHRDVV
jgi:hypothetical protein